ncbi:tripartite motif-containing protein 64-like [Sminthopsis crassicaudata]|uniref:tripartite motif-containing protein 64-like n=1 Tax=Sminthopsis crassicaudata TaxID=9301 RepID=UPI003D685922
MRSRKESEKLKDRLSERDAEQNAEPSPSLPGESQDKGFLRTTPPALSATHPSLPGTRGTFIQKPKGSCRERATDILRCPECRGVIRYHDLVPNRQLQNLSVIGKQLRPHLLHSTIGLTTCDQHGNPQKFFCEEDQTLLCDSCKSAPQHKAHKVLPLKTVAEKCRDELQEMQTTLGETEKEFEMMLDKVRRKKASCKENEYALKHSVMFEYEKIHQFLWDEEYEYLEKLQEESRDGILQIHDNMDEVTQQIQSLQQMMSEIEKTLDKPPLEMLQDMKGILERNEQLLLLEEPELVSPSLNLKRVQYRSVHRDLPDIEDGKDCTLAVWGAQTFTSGKHYWEVEVEGKTGWELGVCRDSVKGKGKLSSSEDRKTLASSPCGNSFFLLNSQNGFHLKQPVLKVGVLLDYENKSIAFYDVRERSLIHILSNTDFEGPLCPYFSFVIKEDSPPASLILC